MYGDGLYIRDWIFVEDHCRAIHMVLEKGIEGEIYNIGGSEEKTNLEVLQTILQLLQKEPQLIKYINDRKGHDRRYSMDSSKILMDLGWKASVAFEAGIKKTVEWYKTMFERG